jgi:hypothetical protein
MIQYKMDEQEERLLVEALKQSPEFECLPIPASWFKKYDIPPRTACGPREYIHSNYAINCSIAPKDLPPIVLKEPQKDKDGNVILVEMVKVEEPPLEVRERPFQLQEGQEFPVVLVDENDAIVKKD